MVDVKRLFIGAGCNRIVNNVSWGACDLIAFGAQNSVAIFCPKTAQILTSLPGHNATVNCTQWLPSNKFAYKAKQLERHYLLSGDADGRIFLWELSLVDRKWRYVLQVPQTHKKGVTCITGIMVSETVAIFASTSSDCTVFVWEFVFATNMDGDCTLSRLESLNVGSKAMVALSMAELPESPGHVVLAMGGLDNKVHIYCGERKGKDKEAVVNQFVCACELKGHTDWIRSLDFSLPICINGEKSLLLVSSSQDKGIRIWKMALRGSVANTQSTCRKEEISLASYIKGPVLVAGLVSYQISLESLLIGHEDWVYSVEWQPPCTASAEGIACYQPQSILSASMDKTMMIWQPERTTGLWMNVVTVGELSHCALGFYGGHWSANGDSILAHGYGGSFHLWKNVGTNIDNWQPQKVPSGHFAAVTDIAWARFGEYILSVSHDQTTRIFTPWKTEVSLTGENSWHEIARPQVHGHDINCVTIIKGKGNHRFVSGADEKVARVFEAPLSFLKTLKHANIDNSDEELHADVQIFGANMSALGLSQKPIYVQSTHEIPGRDENDGFDTLETIPDAVPVVFTEPPIEDQLAWNTLWPESHKLYGHGNELLSLCCDHKGKLIASSCVAKSAAVAEIWLWEVGSWKSVGRLLSHNSSVTQMEFSHDDNFLLAVSKDRQFSVFAIKRTGTGDIGFQLIDKQEAHKRIIWTCSWNPCGNEFATGSRDRTVKIWAVGKESSSVKKLETLPPFHCSVTAISWASRLDCQKNDGVLAIGLEYGLIQLWNIEVGGSAATLLIKLDPLMCHVSSVNRLAWNLNRNKDYRSMQLASCGADHSVRLFEVTFD